MAIKIVIADDAPFIREVIKEIADTHNFQVVGEASNGNEVIAMADQLRPDIIIMDIVMPEKNGVEATEEILAQHPQIKIIACTTVNNEGIVLKALKAGACDFVTKPFSQEKLVAAIQKSMGFTQENTL